MEDLDIINLKLGKVLKRYREKKHYSQEFTAESLGISTKFLSRIENGRSGTSYSTILKLINFLEITPNILYKDLIDNKKILDNIVISEKLYNLPDEKLSFIKGILNMLEQL